MKRTVPLTILLSIITILVVPKEATAQEWLPKKTDDSISIPNLAEELIRQDVDHWKIVLSQAIVESGWGFDSYLYKRTNNFIGMRIPYARESMRVGAFKGYSVYGSWKDCVKDIKMWQLHNWDGGTAKDYISLMHDIWSESPRYYSAVYSVSKRIDRMIARQKKQQSLDLSYHTLQVDLLNEENKMLGDL